MRNNKSQWENQLRHKGGTASDIVTINMLYQHDEGSNVNEGVEYQIEVVSVISLAL